MFSIIIKIIAFWCFVWYTASGLLDVSTSHFFYGIPTISKRSNRIWSTIIATATVIFLLWGTEGTFFNPLTY